MRADHSALPSLRPGWTAKMGLGEAENARWKTYKFSSPSLCRLCIFQSVWKYSNTTNLTSKTPLPHLKHQRAKANKRKRTPTSASGINCALNTPKMAEKRKNQRKKSEKHTKKRKIVMSAFIVFARWPLLSYKVFSWLSLDISGFFSGFPRFSIDVLWISSMAFPRTL